MSRPKPKTKIEREELLLQIVKNCSAVAHALMVQPVPRKPPAPEPGPKLLAFREKAGGAA